MKKILGVLSIAIILAFSSCSENSRAKKWGGEMTINVPAGNKVTNITWKEGDLWYSFRPFQNGEIPTTQSFVEDSQWGMFEGAVTFVETE